MNRPVPFPGTPEQAAANYQTHYFDNEMARCLDCDCRPWGTYANYPCGASVPREDVDMKTTEPGSLLERLVYQGHQ